MLEFAILMAAMTQAGATPTKLPTAPVARVAIEDKHLETIKISNTVYVFKPKIDWTHGNGVAIIGPNGVFFIDTYMQFNYAEEAIRRLRRVTSLPVRYLLNTHWHFDHVMGNGVFKRVYPDCQIIAQDSTAAFLESKVKPRVHDELDGINGAIEQLDSEIRAGKMENGTPIVGSLIPFWELQLREAREYKQQYRPEQFAGADMTFGDTLIIRWGGQTLRLMHMAENGHSAGDVVVWIPETRLLVAGDLVVGPTPYATYRNIPGMTSGIHALIALNPAIIIPGHGPVEHDLSYMQLLERAFTEYRGAAETALANKVPLAEAAKTISFPEIDRQFVPHGDELMKWAYQSFFVKNLIANTYRYPTGNLPDAASKSPKPP